MSGRGWHGSTVRDARAYWATQLPLPCSKCKRPVVPGQRWQVDHLIPRALGGDLTDRANQWPAHGRCNERAGTALGMQIKNARKKTNPVGAMTAETSRGIRGI